MKVQRRWRQRGRGLVGVLLGVILAGGACTFTGPTLDDGYVGLSWEEKLDVLWRDRVLATRYAELPPLGAGWYLDQLNHGLSLMASGIGIDQMHKHVGDEMPAGRYKVTHQYGVMARVALVPVEEPAFGGILRGAEGVARFALAAPESLFDSFIPALAVKFPVSGQPSLDVLVTDSLPGQGSNRDFFARSFSNVVPPARPEDGLLLNAVAAHFATEDPHGDGTRLSLDHLVTVEQDGRPAEGRAPWQLLFVPHRDVVGLISPDSTDDYRRDLMRLQPGQNLYDVFARQSAGDDELVRVGTLELRSEPVASEWGDRHVFFRHRL